MLRAATGSWWCIAMTTDYSPVSCDLHSEFELLAMRRALVRLDAQLSGEEIHDLECRVLDVQTRDGAEYLELEDLTGRRLSCRLDRIRALRLEDGRQISV